MVKPLAFVIEDDYDVARFLKETMIDAGYEVVMILDGDEAGQELTKQQPHLIILDLHLPGLDGRKLLAQIRQDVRLATTRVILITADAQSGINLEQEEKNLYVLIKPVSFEQLKQLAKRFQPT